MFDYLRLPLQSESSLWLCPLVASHQLPYISPSPPSRPVTGASSQVNAKGELAVQVQWNNKSLRFVMDVPFKDRKLRMGTEATEAGSPKKVRAFPPSIKSAGSASLIPPPCVPVSGKMAPPPRGSGSSDVEKAREKAKQVLEAQHAGGRISYPSPNGLARPQGQDYDGYLVQVNAPGGSRRRAPPVPNLRGPWGNESPGPGVRAATVIMPSQAGNRVAV